MRTKTYYSFILILFFSNCNSTSSQSNVKVEIKKNQIVDGYNPNLLNSSGKTVKERFIAPKDFERAKYSEKDFGFFLEQIPLKPIDQLVNYYNGKQKERRNIYASVVDLSIGSRDLHQCADAVMRLRADYLYQQKKFDQIHFNFLSDGKPRYYKDYAKSDYSYSKYWKYLEYIFAYANTASLHDELTSVKSLEEVQIGDTFVQKGKPIGHAIIVIDLVTNPQTGKKLVLLAQSYMPAQDLQILNNPTNKNISPWYELSGDVIRTPEWTFYPENLKTWN